MIKGKDLVITFDNAWLDLTVDSFAVAYNNFVYMSTVSSADPMVGIAYQLWEDYYMNIYYHLNILETISEETRRSFKKGQKKLI